MLLVAHNYQSFEDMSEIEWYVTTTRVEEHLIRHPISHIPRMPLATTYAVQSNTILAILIYLLRPFA